MAEERVELLEQDLLVRKNKMLVGVIIGTLILGCFIVLNVKLRYEKEVRILGEKLVIISSARSTLQQALRKSIHKNVKYKGFLREERKRNAELAKQISALNYEMSLTKTGVTYLKGKNEALKNKIAKLERENNSLRQEVTYFKKSQDNLRRKIKRLLISRGKAELSHVVVTPLPLVGKILKANREYNFVIVDLGKKNGLTRDTVLTVYRDDKAVGDIEIEKLYDEMAVGKSTFEWVGDEIAVGDIVKEKQ